MMCAIDLLKKVLVEDIVQNTRCDKGAHCLVLKEKGRDAKLKNLTIRGLPQNSIAFKMDDHAPEATIINSCNDVLKRCDYLILSKQNGRYDMLFCEMKSLNTKGYTKKLLPTKCFIEYCDLIAKYFYGKRFLDKCDTKYVLFYYKKSPDKRPTGYPGVIDSGKDIEKPLRIPVYKDNETICYSQLMS